MGVDPSKPWKDGFAEGYDQGLQKGYLNGKLSKTNELIMDNKARGFDDGKAEAYRVALVEGEKAGVLLGREVGKRDGLQSSLRWREGYERGMVDGVKGIGLVIVVGGLLGGCWFLLRRWRESVKSRGVHYPLAIRNPVGETASLEKDWKSQFSKLRSIPTPTRTPELVTIKICENEDEERKECYLPAHRDLLGVRCAYFRRILEREPRVEIIELGEYNVGAVAEFWVVLEWMYVGQAIPVDPFSPTIHHLLKWIQILELESLLKNTETELSKMVSSKNLKNLYKIAKLHNLQNLLLACENFIESQTTDALAKQVIEEMKSIWKNKE